MRRCWWERYPGKFQPMRIWKRGLGGVVEIYVPRNPKMRFLAAPDRIRRVKLGQGRLWKRLAGERG